MKSRIIVMVCMLLVASGAATAKYSGGTGEANEPYRIATAADLNDIGNHVEDFNKCFVMVSDINLAQYTGAQFNIIGPNSTTPFTGVFDGNGHTICNFTFQTDADRANEPVGIFAMVFDAAAAIDDLHLVEPNIACPNARFVGSLVGFLGDGTVSGCTCINGRILGDSDVGGLIGMYYQGRVENCHVRATVSCEYMLVGGLAGDNGGTIISSSSAGSVYGENGVGGLAGGNGGNQKGATIEDCYSTAQTRAQHYFAGGLVGYNSQESLIQGCYANGCVDGNEYAGGLVGLAYDCNISDCYAMGAVGANKSVGGLVGGIRESLVENCYAGGPVSGDANVGAVAGRSYGGNSIFIKSFWDSDINPDVNGIGNTSDPNVIGKTTAEMQTEGTFTNAGWDFAEVWGIGEGQTYPFLRVHPAGDINHDGIVNFRDFAILAGHWLEEK